ncbi:hypothetical protein E5D57_006244 [Metarhizium anisopliae]|nr:hypothetical protein E5D57_006244 [Metarhizium anisopliae]
MIQRWIRNAEPRNLTAIKSSIDKPRMPLVVQLANKDNQPRVPIKKSTYHSSILDSTDDDSPMPFESSERVMVPVESLE